MSYTISFFNNGYGQNLEPLTGVTTIPNLPILEEEGFTFEGWYLDEDLTVLAEVGADLISDITLYASWTRMRDYTNNNTYVLIGPDINITPGDGGGGSGGSSDDSGSSLTSYYEGNSYIRDYYPSLKDYVFKDNSTYCSRCSTQITAARFLYNSSYYMKIPKSLGSSSEDSWVEEVELPFYYNTTAKNDSTKTQIKVIKPGSKPTFTTKLFEWDGQYDPDTYGQWIVTKIYKSSSMLTFKTYDFYGDTLINTQYFTPSENIVDGSIPDKIILVLQAAGGGGGNSKDAGIEDLWTKWNGGGGNSGNAAAIVLDINNAAVDSDYPVAQVYIPTRTPATEDGLSINVFRASGWTYDSYGKKVMDYRSVCAVTGGYGTSGKNSTTPSASDSAMGWDEDFSEGYENTYWWKLKTRSWQNWESSTSYWSIRDFWLSMAGGTAGARTTAGNNGYGSGEADPNSTDYSNQLENSTTPSCYFYNSHYFIGSSGSGKGANNLNAGEYLLVGGFAGGRANNGGGGGSSLFGQGGSGGSSSSTNGTAGGIGAGGGGARNPGTGGMGGGGYVAIYY